MVKKIAPLFTLMGALIAISLPAGASLVTFDWNVTGATATGSGTITADSTGTPGVYLAQSMDGTFADTANGISGMVSDPFVATGSQETSLDGLYYYDQTLYSPPSSGAPPQSLDSTSGLLFVVTGGTGAEVNIYGGGSSAPPNDYQLLETITGTNTYIPPSAIGYPVDFTITEVASAPEPKMAIPLSIGLLILAFAYHRRLRHQHNE